MTIVLYTSTSRNEVDEYNIYQVLHRYLALHDFIVLEVLRKKKRKPKWKFLLSELKHGQNHMKKDHSKAFKTIADLTNNTLIKSIENHFLVDDVNGLKSIKILKELKPDLIIQCGAGILKSEIFRLARFGTINVHHGLAPEIRGVSSILWAYYYGLKIGVTVHIIDENLDTGPVLSQYEHTQKENSFVDLYIKCIVKGGELLAQVIGKVPIKEPEFEESQVASYYFSSFDWRTYNDFKKSGFAQMEIPESKKFKYLIKRTLVSK